MSQNIWIRIAKIYYGVIYRSYRDLMFLITGSQRSSEAQEYPLTHEIVSGGPDSFYKKPTAIKLGRAIFVPIILISQLYARNTETK